MDLKILSYCPELDPQTREQCGYEVRTSVGGQVVRVPLEARFPYFAQGYVGSDIPRSSAFSDDIVRATKGFAIADPQGNVLGKFKTAKEAEEARKGAKLELKIAVPEPVAEPEVAAEPVGAAAE